MDDSCLNTQLLSFLFWHNYAVSSYIFVIFLAPVRPHILLVIHFSPAYALGHMAAGEQLSIAALPLKLIPALFQLYQAQDSWATNVVRSMEYVSDHKISW